MSYEIIGKNKARLYASFGSGERRERKSKTITYSGKKDLERQHQEFINQFNGNSEYDGSTIEQLINDYIDNRRILGLKPTTISGYEDALKRLNSRFKQLKADEVTTYHIDNLIVKMGEKYSPKSIRNTISLINASYKRAIKLGMLQNNPCDNATLPKSHQEEISTLDEENAYKLMVALQSERADFKVAYELCLLCGLRRSEVLGLREEDVNLNFRTITIHETRHAVKGKESLQTPKTERSRRTLALPDLLCEHIQELIELHDSYDFVHDDYLILNAWGKRLHPASMTAYLPKLLNKYGIEHVSVHGLRHTFATMLNANGIDIARISQELGHSNISVTMNKYTHIFGNASSSSRGIADALNDKFSENGQISVKCEK